MTHEDHLSARRSCLGAAREAACACFHMPNVLPHMPSVPRDPLVRRKQLGPKAPLGLLGQSLPLRSWPRVAMGGTSWVAYGCVRDTVMQLSILSQLAKLALNNLQRKER